MTAVHGTPGLASGSLPDLLAGYDRRVDDIMRRALRATSGNERVRWLHALRRSVAVHDSVLGSALCPLLDDLPGGEETAERLRRGCHERAALLERFQDLTRGVAATNVYPVAGEEVEDILTRLAASFRDHEQDETSTVARLLESSAGSVDPEVIAARMAIESGRAPTRSHPATDRHPGAGLIRGLYRYLDRWHDWSDTHHGWPAQPGEELPVRPAPPPDQLPSVPDLLAGYDGAAHALIAALDRARDDALQRAQIAYRLAAAITVHDSVVEGTLCPLLDAVDDGHELAARLRAGCQQRAAGLMEWEALATRVTPDDLYRSHAAAADAILTPVIDSFRSHERQETVEVAAFIDGLRQRPWPWRGSGGEAQIWVWPNPEPAVLAATMALWSEHAPTRAHRTMARHPTSRVTRNAHHVVDRWRDRRDTRRGWPRRD